MRAGVYVTWVGALLCAAAAPACSPDQQGTRLADMTNKRLSISAPGSITLYADGCPLLIPGQVEATINDHPMKVSPGYHGTGIYAGPCTEPRFDLTEQIDLGSTATIVIKDPSQTVRAVIVGLREPPTLEPPNTEPWPLHRGDPVRVSFVSTGEAPDYAAARAAEANTSTSGAPCGWDAEAPAIIDGNTVAFAVPTTLCYGAAALTACVGYTTQPQVESCDNATCAYDPGMPHSCTTYPIEIVPGP